MRKTAVCAALAAALLAGRQGAALAESGPLFLPKAERALPVLSAAEAAELKKEAEGLKRKAMLLKDAAGKKYAAAADLRRKAGGFRSESAKRGEMLRSKAEQSAAVSSFLGDMFSLMSGMGGMGGGGFNSNAALAQALTAKMIQSQQASDAKSVMEAQAKAGQITTEAERKAGPLEMRADELENEGNRLMEAHNRLMGIANAKFLLVAAHELAAKVAAESRAVDRLEETCRGALASVSSR